MDDHFLFFDGLDPGIWRKAILSGGIVFMASWNPWHGRKVLPWVEFGDVIILRLSFAETISPNILMTYKPYLLFVTQRLDQTPFYPPSPRFQACKLGWRRSRV